MTGTTRGVKNFGTLAARVALRRALAVAVVLSASASLSACGPEWQGYASISRVSDEHFEVFVNDCGAGFPSVQLARRGDPPTTITTAPSAALGGINAYVDSLLTGAGSDPTYSLQSGRGSRSVVPLYFKSSDLRSLPVGQALISEGATSDTEGVTLTQVDSQKVKDLCR